MQTYIKNDLRSAVVVALIALPLCLGISFASGAPLISGLISGIIGGIVVGAISKSTFSVSGPAAGLTVVVLDSITQLGSIESFLPAVILAGAFQLLLGRYKAGELAFFVPSSVIKGMTAAIGLILVLKQIPHAVGYSMVAEGEMSFKTSNNENTFSSILFALQSLNPGAVIVSLLCFLTILLAEIPGFKKSFLGLIMPGPLLAVLIGISLNHVFLTFIPTLALSGNALVQLPVADSIFSLYSTFPKPDWSVVSDFTVWKVAIMLALIASLETLLGIEAIDKLDPYRRVTPPNRELIAQGFGNIFSGLAGGIPVTSVVVRSSANVEAGASSKYSAIIHGLILMFFVLFIPGILNQIPLAALAAVLIRIGYKLTSPKVLKEVSSQNINQLIPFIVTIVAVMFTDLLTGVLIGISAGIIFVLRANFHSAVTLTNYKGNFLIKLQKDVSFLNKARITETLESVPANSKLIIDGTMADFIDADIMEVINNYYKHASLSNISVKLEGIDSLQHTISGVSK